MMRYIYICPHCGKSPETLFVVSKDYVPSAEQKAARPDLPEEKQGCLMLCSCGMPVTWYDLVVVASCIVFQPVNQEGAEK